MKKNYTIAELADSLFAMTGLARSGNYSQALNTLDTSVATAYRRYPNMEDDDIRFILGIVEGYRRDDELRPLQTTVGVALRGHPFR